MADKVVVELKSCRLKLLFLMLRNTIILISALYMLSEDQYSSEGIFGLYGKRMKFSPAMIRVCLLRLRLMWRQ